MNDAGDKASALCIHPLGQALSQLLLISYLLCVGFGLLAPEDLRMYEAWSPLLPGFELRTWPGELIGAVEAWLYDWYAVVVFVPLYRWFSTRGNSA